MRNRFRLRLLFVGVSVSMAVGPAAAINIRLDDTYDTTDFFGNGNPDGPTAGQQAREALDAAADYFSFILDDTFSSIQTPPPFHSQILNGYADFEWTMNFNNPTTSTPVTITDPFVAADEYRIYVGARNLPDNTLGIGGPGGFSCCGTSTGNYTQTEINQLNQIFANFEADVVRRDEPSGFARWGGTLSFDRDESTSWHFDHTAPVPAGRSDFFSVALHELGHALGLGSSVAWNDRVSGTFFTGPAASLEYGGPVPLDGDLSHWAEGTMSTIYGTSIPQEVALDPRISTGQRKRLTDLDAAALKDIGWTVVAPPPLPPEGVDGDYNGNGIVDAADYTLWRDTRGATVAAGTGADGDANGVVGPNDYAYWKNRFGNTSGSGTLVAHAGVPEPSLGALFAAGLWIGASGRRSLRRV